MEWVTENWKIIAAVAGGIALVGLFAVMLYGIGSGKVFSESPVKDWTISEAIFYGCALIAFATFISR